jgi:uncharacterized protein
MQCPIDKQELQNHVFELNVTVDKCATCQGVFLDQGELEKLEAEALKAERHLTSEEGDGASKAYDFARQANLPEIKCPKCLKLMERSEYGYCSGVLIDRCLECQGIWLDGGELLAIQKFYEHADFEAKPLPKRVWMSVALMVKEKFGVAK